MTAPTFRPRRRLAVGALAVLLLLTGSAQALAAKVNIYLTRDTRLQMVERQLPNGADPLTFSVAALFAGPTKTELKDGITSPIPKRARLIETVLRGNVLYVRVSSEFGAGGTGTQIQMRLAQLVYTALQYKQVNAVRLLLDDEPMPAEGEDGSALLDHSSVPKVEIVGPIPISITAVQTRLIELRYLRSGQATGRLDYRTSQALLAFQGWEGLLRTGAATVETRVRLNKAAIPKPRKRTESRRMEVTRWKGVLLLIQHGEVQHVVHVSTGAGGRTPRGSFGIYRKERMSWSNPFSVWLPWASYFSGGYAFHQYPHVPGYPASHGCIRVGAPEARGVYSFANYGTPVSIV